MSDTTNPQEHQEGQTSPRSPLPQERGVLELLKGIQDGRISPRSLTIEERRACVQHLGVEGYSVPSIAKVLNRSERAIARDRKAIKEAQALDPGSDLTCQLAGQLIVEADTTKSQIRRAARGQDVPPSTKVEAERVCFEIQCNLTNRLQSLGFANTAGTRVTADLTHRLDGMPSYEQIFVQIDHLIQVADKAADPAVTQQATQLKQLAAKSQIVHEVQTVTQQIQGETNHD